MGAPPELPPLLPVSPPGLIGGAPWMGSSMGLGVGHFFLPPHFLSLCLSFFLSLCFFFSFFLSLCLSFSLWMPGSFSLCPLVFSLCLPAFFSRSWRASRIHARSPKT